MHSTLSEFDRTVTLECCCYEKSNRAEQIPTILECFWSEQYIDGAITFAEREKRLNFSHPLGFDFFLDDAAIFVFNFDDGMLASCICLNSIVLANVYGDVS